MLNFLNMLQTILATLDVVVTDHIEASFSNLWAGGGRFLDGWPEVGVSTGQFVVGGRIGVGGRVLARTCQGTSPQGPRLFRN